MAMTKVLCAALTALSFVNAISAQYQPAPPCTNETVCDLPDCRCSSTDIPGGIPPLQTPQIVLLTFDDGVTISNFPFYERLLYGRKNPNGASIGATFFITHENTNYSLVHELWANGHEIALHSITHQVFPDYWINLNVSGWEAEVVDQRETVETFARIPQGHIKGVRAPFLQIGGNFYYDALHRNAFSYDCSRPTVTYRTPGLWPYTNDFLSHQDCQIPPCPTASFPGFWTVPMVVNLGGNNEACSMIDACLPLTNTTQETYELLMRNFEDHYNGNRAPYGVFAHSAWLQDNENRTLGYEMFLDELSTYRDVYFVTVSEALEWVKDPQPSPAAVSFPPWQDENRTPNCPSVFNCEWTNPLRNMASCISCPYTYPWLHNHLGEP